MVVRYHQTLPLSSAAKFDAVLVVNIMIRNHRRDGVGGTFRVSGR